MFLVCALNLIILQQNLPEFLHIAFVIIICVVFKTWAWYNVAILILFIDNRQ